MVISVEDRLASPYLARLAGNLTARMEASGMLKPDFAASIGISGSQFRYLRARMANPTIRMLADIAEKLRVPLYELLEGKPLGRRRDLSADEMNAAYSEMINHKYRNSGMSDRDFAKIIGVSWPQLYLIMRQASNPSLLVVENIAERSKVGLWQLLGVETNDNRK